MIKDAIKTTEIGLNNVLKELAAGRYEYNLRNVFEFHVHEDLDAGIAFDSIVAGGKMQWYFIILTRKTFFMEEI